MTIGAVKLEHLDLAEHQAAIFEHLQAFRKDHQLCDVVLKCHDGTEHCAHLAVLCAASGSFKDMLLGPFREAGQVQQGQPVEMAASDGVVSALLEYIYGGQPSIDLDDSIELLRLADAYNLPKLKMTIEAGLRASLHDAPVVAALKILKQTQDLHDLHAECEDKIAVSLEQCFACVDFLDLNASQLARILQREDLSVSREEVVLEGLFRWLNNSPDRGAFLGVLLRNIDFQALASSSLAKLRHHCASMGPKGHDLQREVHETLRARRRRAASADPPDAFRPKRRCLQHWSPELGASLTGPRKVLSRLSQFVYSLCWHDGAIYFVTGEDDSEKTGGSIRRWKPGDMESRTVAGRGARVNGANEFSSECELSVSPDGQVFVADEENDRLLRFHEGSGTLVLGDMGIRSVFCSPNGAVYVLTHNGEALHKLIGETVQLVISNEHLPQDRQFCSCDLFVTKDETIYISDYASKRILRINPGEIEPVVLSDVPDEGVSIMSGHFGTDDGKLYFGILAQHKVWAFDPRTAAWTEVLQCPGQLRPDDLVVQGRSLYVNIINEDDDEDPAGGVYEYLLPPELQLE